MPSEIEYGIVEQPANTCPLIDSALDSLNKALKELKGWRKMDEEELRNACDFTEWYLQSLNSELEDIRKHAAKIREWGQDWKDLAKQHAPKQTCSKD